MLFKVLSHPNHSVVIDQKVFELPKQKVDAEESELLLKAPGGGSALSTEPRASSEGQLEPSLAVTSLRGMSTAASAGEMYRFH